MTGLITHGMPVCCAAARNSSSEVAYAYFAVRSPSSFAATSRMATRFMVRNAASAVGITVMPLLSNSRSFSVRMASISGTIMSGWCFSTTRASASASSMGITSNASATCMAGAPA